jgi:hypothetical protein
MGFTHVVAMDYLPGGEQRQPSSEVQELERMEPPF